ncbi:ABC-type transport auxiliary lipoprotein family protein [Aromatoleum sp.]|uniref:ABC-type transport auxiliary lipoprotein family protein n=1 Tax=Aromatoleum sp. TaxID=2307007 RepID=UPI002FC69E2D
MFVTRPYKWAAVLVLSLAVAGCGNLGVPAARFAFFDLGVATPVDPPLPLALARVEVRAPTWLSTGAMQYRIEYRQPAKREAYSETRWVAEPAEMLGLALDRALVPDRGAGGKCRLRVELDEFVQEFETARGSHAIIIARPSLIAPRSDDVVAQSALMIREQAPTPDAAGGVIAHRRAARRLANEIAGWITGLDSADRQGSGSLERCGQ